MDWNGAIEQNREALKRIVAMLVALAGVGAPSLLPLWEKVSPSSEHGEDEIRRRMRGVGRIADVSDSSSTPHPTSPSFHSGSATFSHKGRREGARPTLPRRLHRAILRLLRPAESAVRRLIVIAARGLVVAPSRPRTAKPKPRPASIFVRNGVGTGIVIPRGVVIPPGVLPHRPRPAPRSLSLPLLDPLQTPFLRRRPKASGVPCISFPGFTQPFPVAVRRPPSLDDRLDATRLVLRFQALASALDDIPGQARRFARWRANRDAARNNRDAAGTQGKNTGKVRRFRRFSPLRPGRPPGSRRRPDHEVHGILNDLHGLAFDVLEHPDTS